MMVPLVIDISAWITPATDTVTAITTAIPTLATSAAVIAAGLIGLKLAFRVVKSVAK